MNSFSSLNQSTHLLWAAGIFLFIGLLLSCDNNLQVLDQENGLYSIYGNLDLDERTNYIRVRDLNAPFTKEATFELGAEVTFENVETGGIETLQSERVEYQSMYLHNYVVHGEIKPDTEYRVNINRSNSTIISETLRTPTRPNPIISPENPVCDSVVTLTMEPLNGGTVVIRYGTDLETWTFPFEFGPNRYVNSNSISTTFTPITVAQLASGYYGTCSQLLSNNILYIRVAHYAPGFYEKATDELDQPDDILESTRLMGASYEDTLAIAIDTSSE